MHLPTVSGTVLRAGHPVAWLLAGLAAVVIAFGMVAYVLRRRRRVLRFDASLAEVPVRIDGAGEGVCRRIPRGGRGQPAR